MNKITGIMLLLALFSPVTVHAKDGVVEYCATHSGKNWHCSGELELTLAKDAETIKFKRTIFDNDEVLSEIEVRGSVFQHLTVEPSQVELSLGKIPDSSGEAVLALIMPEFALSILESAYPSGPDSIPVTKATKVAKMVDKDKGELLLNVTTTPTLERIEFLVENEAEKTKLTGYWNGKFVLHLPDDFDLTGWEMPGITQKLESLGAARSVKTEALSGGN